MRGAGRTTGDRGFTLIEALVALAIGGFVIAVVATITGQWIRSWQHGFPLLQRSELMATSLDRIVADLAAARFMPAGATGPGLIFIGAPTAITLVRRALPVEGAQGLEVVRLGPPPGRGEATLARSRSPLSFGSLAPAPRDPAPVVLLRAPYAARFSYADQDQQWQTNWTAIGRLPRLIRVSIVDRDNGRALLEPVIVAVHVDAPMRCSTAPSARACDAAMGIAPPLGAPRAQTRPSDQEGGL